MKHSIIPKDPISAFLVLLGIIILSSEEPLLRYGGIIMILLGFVWYLEANFSISIFNIGPENSESSPHEPTGNLTKQMHKGLGRELKIVLFYIVAITAVGIIVPIAIKLIYYYLTHK